MSQLPPKFKVLRPTQVQALADLQASTQRVKVVCAPTGSGKSGIAVAHHLESSGRSVILTSTKGLQEQYKEDFSSIGLFNVKGRNAYTCVTRFKDKKIRNCDEGAKEICGLRGTTGCPAKAASLRARQVDLVSTNYSFWIASNLYAGGLGHVDRLICDEAHGLVNLIEEHLSVKLYKRSGQPKSCFDIEVWKKWAGTTSISVKADLDKLRKKVVIEGKQLTLQEKAREEKLIAYLYKLVAITKMGPSWIIDENSAGDTIEFNPLWPREHAERLIFQNVKSIILTSATITPKICEVLGLSTFDFLTYPSTFDPARSPIYIARGVPRMKYGVDAADVELWLTKICRIVSNRLHLKGIIHTVSYPRARQIIERLKREFPSCDILTHTNATERDSVIQQYKKYLKPCILVSPSITTGFDFPGDECRYQIISKIPFEDNKDRRRLSKARKEADPRYSLNSTLQDLVQTVGRAMRSENDWCETWVTDAQFGWVVYNNQDLVTPQFLGMCKAGGERPTNQKAMQLT